MKILASLLVAAIVVMPSSGAYAQFAAAPGGPNGSGGFACSHGFVEPGEKATLEQISKAHTATVHRVDGCQDIYVEFEFQVSGQAKAISENEKLRRQLRNNGVMPHQIIGVKQYRGELTVFIPSNG